MEDTILYDKGWVDIPIENLVKAHWNYKKDDPYKQAKLTENIRRNGFIQNLIVRPLSGGLYEVVNGNHRLDVCYELEHPEVHCYNVGDISQAQAQRIAIETNETSFESDVIALSGLLGDLQEEFSLEDLEATLPYTADEITEMEKLSSFTADEFEAEMAAPEKKEKKDKEPEADDGMIKTITISFVQAADQAYRESVDARLREVLMDDSMILYNGQLLTN